MRRTRTSAAGPEQPPPRRRRPPAPLVALLATTLILGLAWTLVTPAFQAPDENSHFAYLQSLIDGPGLPGNPARPVYSTEQQLAASASNADQAAAQVLTKMTWDAPAYDRWNAQEAHLPATARTDGGGPNPAASNPPLYYLTAGAAYALADRGDLFDRLFAGRVVSVLWLLVTVTAVWMLAGELVRRDPALQLAAAAVAAMAPMMTFVSGSVSPDAALFALWSLAIWLGVRLLRRGITTRGALALATTVGAACLVKATSYALLPATAVAVGAGLWRARPAGLAVLRPLAAAAAGLALTLGAWIAIAHVIHRPTSAQVSAAATTQGFNFRYLLSYVWQFYLPRMPFQTTVPFLGPHAAYDIWIKGAWGSFGWLEVRFPKPVYWLFAAVTLLVTASAGVVLWRGRRRTDWAVVVFVIAVIGTLLAGLHWTEYRQIVAGAGMFNQGRYLLPLVGVAGAAVAQALRLLPRLWRPVGSGLVVGCLFVLQLFSLGLMLGRFYA